MGSSRHKAKPLPKHKKSRRDRVHPKNKKNKKSKKSKKSKTKSWVKDNEALQHQLLEKMLPDASYVPVSQDQSHRPHPSIVMRIYTGVEERDTLDIRSDSLGALQCVSEFAEGHGMWTESNGVKDPDNGDCHRIWVVDDPSQHRPFPDMLPLLFKKFMERVLGYKRVYAKRSYWMFERTSAFKRLEEK